MEQSAKAVAGNDTGPVMERIRQRVVSGIHLGHLAPGSRMPSVRVTANELAADHRAVAQAYHALEREGLLEVRGRRGTFVSRPGKLTGELIDEKARWLRSVLIDARRRGTAVPEFPRLVQAWTASRPLRCACIESSEDALTALCGELADDFGVHSVPVHAETLAAAPDGPPALPDAARDAHLIVATSFHAPLAHRVAGALGKPAVIVTMATEIVALIERHVAERPLTLICVDEAFGRRFANLFSPDGLPEPRVRVVAASNSAAIAGLPDDAPVLLTRAALVKLPNKAFPARLPFYPSISHESGGELLDLLIRHNLAQTAAS